MQRLNNQRRKYVPSWEPERYIVPLLRRKIPDTFRNFIAQNTSMHRRALDIGCGLQPWKSLLQDANFEYMSFDVVQNSDGNVDFIGPIDGKLCSKILSQAPFDFLLLTEVLEHVANWEAAFANLNLLSKSGTKVLLTVPHVYPLHEAPFDFWRPTPYAIREFADKHGFDVVHIEKAGGPFTIFCNVKSPLADVWIL
mgnify:CR=1 FL=1